MSKTKQVKCPLCREYLELEDSLQKGDIVYCPDCEEELKIVRLDPPKLKSIVEILEVYKDGHKVVKGDSTDNDDDYTDDYTDDEEDDIVDRFSGFEEMYGEDYE